MERFLGAQIAGTNEPVSHDIEAILPWLADPAIPQMLGGATIDPGTGYQGHVW
jgi:hypothetical protein